MYTPSQEILEKYANVLVNFALRKGKWINPWDIVFVQIPECTKPFLIPLQTAILKAWWHPIIDYIPDGVEKNFCENASDEQLSFVAKEYEKWKVEAMTHYIVVRSFNDLHELDGVDASKLMKRINKSRAYLKLRRKKEKEWKLSRTMCVYWTESMAAEAWLSLEEYREQIILACFLNETNPVKKRKEIDSKIWQIKDKLNDLKLEYIHVIWPDEDLKIKIWSDRLRAAWWWCNIPSYEIFTSPDCRDINGRIKCNQPLYRYWSLVEWIRLEFKDWKVIKATADKNENILHEMIKIEWMDHVWEFSLTDARISRITHFMAETLFDENMWWEYGNTHIALWLWFDECYAWDQSKLDDKEFKKSIWLNFSAEHVDVISTAPRKAIWILPNWEEILIYENGKFAI